MFCRESEGGDLRIRIMVVLWLYGLGQEERGRFGEVIFQDSLRLVRVKGVRVEWSLCKRVVGCYESREQRLSSFFLFIFRTVGMQFWEKGGRDFSVVLSELQYGGLDMIRWGSLCWKIFERLENVLFFKGLKEGFG